MTLAIALTIMSLAITWAYYFPIAFAWLIFFAFLGVSFNSIPWLGIGMTIAFLFVALMLFGPKTDEEKQKEEEGTETTNEKLAPLVFVIPVFIGIMALVQ